MLLMRLFLIYGGAVSQASRARMASVIDWDCARSRQLLGLTPLSCHGCVMSAVETNSLRMVRSVTHKADGGSIAVLGLAEPALRTKTSSEPAVALDTSAAASSNLTGSEISVMMMWIFLRCAARSSSGPAVSKLLIRANTWLFVSLDFIVAG